MKKYTLIFTILILLPFTFAWNDCNLNCDIPSCGAYIDTNDNTLCDHGELDPTKKETLKKFNLTEKKYRLMTFSLISLFGFILTSILSRKKIISKINHRKIWNIILTGSFLVSGLLGILLVIVANGATLNLSFNALKWHVESGIILAWSSIFHALWHIPYFKTIFKFS